MRVNVAIVPLASNNAEYSTQNVFAAKIDGNIQFGLIGQKPKCVIPSSLPPFCL
jgi:hypothetical protein